MWDWLDYGALIAGAITILAGLALLSVRVLQAWRSFKRLRRHVFRDLDRLAEKTDAALARIDSVSDTGELQQSLGSLRTSLARLALLREAFAEATSFTALIPRK